MTNWQIGRANKSKQEWEQWRQSKQKKATVVIACLFTAVLLVYQAIPSAFAERTPVFAAPSNNPFGLTDIGDNSAPTFADIDGDGDWDAFIGRNDGNVTYFQNIGSTISPSYTPSGINPFGLTDVGDNSIPTFADLDGDNDLDAVIGNTLGNLTYFQNLGTTTAPIFAAPSNNPFGLTNVGSDSIPTFADIDGDGDLDALVGNNLGDIVYFQNVGSIIAPTFAAASNNPFGLTNVGGASAPTFADLDGDGDLDLFVGESTGNIAYFQNNGAKTNPSFATVSNNPFNLVDVGDNSTPTYIDIDGDGDFDALVGESFGNVTYFQNTGSVDSPSFAPFQTNPLGLDDVGDDSNPTFADVDGDGDFDAFVGEYFGRIRYFENTGTSNDPTFATAINNPFGFSDIGNISSPTFADLDADGDLDAFIGENAQGVFYFQNTGNPVTPTFTAPITNPFGLTNIVVATQPTFVDLDSDGDLDAFIGERFGTIKYFENIGTAAMPTFTLPITNPFGFEDVGNNSNPTFADIDGDGDLDAFVGHSFGNIKYFQNIGTAVAPAFATPIDNPFGLADIGNFSTPALVDLGGDGDLELVSGTGNGNLFMFRGTANNPLAITLQNSATASSTTLIPTLLTILSLALATLWIRLWYKHE